MGTLLRLVPPVPNVRKEQRVWRAPAAGTVTLLTAHQPMLTLKAPLNKVRSGVHMGQNAAPSPRFGLNNGSEHVFQSPQPTDDNETRCEVSGVGRGRCGPIQPGMRSLINSRVIFGLSSQLGPKFLIKGSL